MGSVLVHVGDQFPLHLRFVIKVTTQAKASNSCLLEDINDDSVAVCSAVPDAVQVPADRVLAPDAMDAVDVMEIPPPPRASKTPRLDVNVVLASLVRRLMLASSDVASA